MTTSTTIEQEANAAIAKINTVLAGVRRHAQTVPATREMEQILSALASQARAAAATSSDPQEMNSWAERVEWAALPDGSEGRYTLQEWRYEVSDAIKPLFDPPASGPRQATPGIGGMTACPAAGRGPARLPRIVTRGRSRPSTALRGSDSIHRNEASCDPSRSSP